MADFSQTGIRDIPAVETPQQGVNDRTSAVTYRGLADVISTVGDAFENIVGAVNQGKNDKFLGRYSQELVTIAQAVDQNSITSTEGMTRIRNAYTRAITANPSLQDDITKRTSSLLTSTGLAGVVHEGSREEQEARRVKNAAVDAGFVSPGATPEEIEVGVNNYRKLKIKEKELEIAQKEITLASTSTSLEAATKSEEAKKVLSEYAYLQQAAFFNKSNDIVSRVNSGALSQEEGWAELQTMWAKVQTVASAASYAGTEFINNTIRPFSEIKDITEKMISGEVTAEFGKTRLDNVKNRAQLEALKIPGIEDAVGIMALLGITNLDNPEIQSIVLGALNMSGVFNKKNNKANVVNPENREGSKAYLGFIKDGMSNVLEGYNPSKGITEEEYKEVTNNVADRVNGVLESIGSANISDPTDLNEVVDFFASPQFGDYVANNSLKISKENLEVANDIVLREYVDNVIPLVRDEFERASVGVDYSRGKFKDVRVGAYPTNSMVNVEFSGSGINFVPVEFSDTAEANAAKAEARRLNKEVGPAINRLIRVTGNLTGNRDYRSVWENNFKERLFPNADDEDKKKLIREARTIINDEGDREDVYDDGLGNLTAGIGHLLTPEELKIYKEGDIVPKEVRDRWFQEDLRTAHNYAVQYLGEDVPEEVLNIATNMMFNMGPNRFSPSAWPGFFGAVANKDWEKAAEEMKNSDWYRQVGYRSKRLINRMKKVNG